MIDRASGPHFFDFLPVPSLIFVVLIELFGIRLFALGVCLDSVVAFLRLLSAASVVTCGASGDCLRVRDVRREGTLTIRPASAFRARGTCALFHDADRPSNCASLIGWEVIGEPADSCRMPTSHQRQATTEKIGQLLRPRHDAPCLLSKNLSRQIVVK